MTTLAPVNVSFFSLLQLHVIVNGAPERRILWTRLELAAAHELDRRLA